MDFGDEAINSVAPHGLHRSAIHTLEFSAVAVVAVSADAYEVEGVDDLFAGCFCLEHLWPPEMENARLNCVRRASGLFLGWLDVGLVSHELSGLAITLCLAFPVADVAPPVAASDGCESVSAGPVADAAGGHSEFGGEFFYGEPVVFVAAFPGGYCPAHSGLFDSGCEVLALFWSELVPEEEDEL